jgi:hypothetical protein
MRSLLTGLLLPVLSFFSLQVSAASGSNASSVFVYSYAPDATSFVFALSVDAPNGDVYFHLSAPSGNSWAGVGIGSEMKESLFFIAYASKNGTGVTLSPRTASGESEPSYYSKVTCDLVYANDLPGANTVTDGGYETVTSGGNGTIQVDAVCHNATSWTVGGKSNSLSTTSTKQDFIFAVGPGTTGNDGSGINSDSLSADLRRHDFYGHFTMDMTKASTTTSGAASVPRPNDASNSSYTLENASAATNTKADNDPAPAIHAFVMCFTFVIIFPLGSLVLRALNSVKGHYIVQIIGFVLCAMASAGGIVISTQYNKSKNFNSAHQVLGILIFIALCAQLGLGIVHHRIFKRDKRPTIMGKIHLYLGPAAIIIGIINAPIGFVFGSNPHLCLPYTVILLLVLIGFISIRFFAHICCGRRFKRNGQGRTVEGGMAPGAEGYQYPQFGPPPGAPPANGEFYGGGYSHMPPPPAYGREDSYRSDDVPLRPYDSQQSGINGSAQQPRPMV